MNISSLVTPTQPSLKGSKIPNGHIQLNSKYHDSEISKKITEIGLNIIYDENLGLIDCYPSTKCAVVIAQENQLINEIEIKKKIKKLSKFPNHKILLIEVSETSQQYFVELQNEMILESSDVKMIPFSSIKDVGLLIYQCAYLENHPNQFTQKSKSTPLIEESLLAFVQSFNGIGEKKALELLKKYQSIKNISAASVEDLSEIIGKSAAASLKLSLT